MKHLFSFFLFLTALVPLTGWADVHLIFWQSQANAPRIILPRLENETPSEAVQRYLHNLETDPGLASLRPQNFQLPIGSSQDLPDEKKSGRVRLAFIANWFQDLTADGARIQRNLRTFSRAGADPYVVGLSADLGLGESDAADFRKQIADQFSMLVSLGGDDIAPEVFGEKATHARNTNAVRDRSEFSLVQTFKLKARGIFFGICRGHQMGAIVDGHSLKQDLTNTGAGTSDHHINFNGGDSTNLQKWHHIIFQDSLLARFLLGKIPPNSRAVYTTEVNSVHHQAVDPKETAASEVVALDDKDGVVEALQGKNKKSFSVQFHPEFPTEVSGNSSFSNRGFQIIQGIVSYSRLVRMQSTVKSCGRVHSF